MKLQLRRLKVLELANQGLNDEEIGTQLEVSTRTIWRDRQWLEANVKIEWGLLTEQVVKEIRKRLTKMQDKDLVRVLNSLAPQKLEGNISNDIIIKMWRPEDDEKQKPTS